MGWGAPPRCRGGLAFKRPAKSLGQVCSAAVYYAETVQRGGPLSKRLSEGYECWPRLREALDLLTLPPTHTKIDGVDDGCRHRARDDAPSYAVDPESRDLRQEIGKGNLH